MLFEWLSSPPARGGYFLLSHMSTYEYSTGTACIARRSEGTFSGQSKLFHGTLMPPPGCFYPLLDFFIGLCSGGIGRSPGEFNTSTVVELDFTIML